MGSAAYPAMTIWVYVVWAGRELANRISRRSLEDDDGLGNRRGLPRV